MPQILGPGPGTCYDPDMKTVPLSIVLALLPLFVPLRSFGEENPLAYTPLPTAQTAPAPEPDLLSRILLFPVTVYANTFSQVDGDRCPSHPSCSGYARAALARHGAVPGIWLTVDRLIHERTEIDSPRRVRLPDGSERVDDTLDSNDFWFHHPPRETP